MNPQKRQRRSNVRRAVSPDEPKKPTRKVPKAVEPPREPGPRKRRTLPKGKPTPGWKAAGLDPRTDDD